MPLDKSQTSRLVKILLGTVLVTGLGIFGFFIFNNLQKLEAISLAQIEKIEQSLEESEKSKRELQTQIRFSKLDYRF
jgi:cell division protein FtsL